MNIDNIARPVADQLLTFEKAFADILHSEIPLAEKVVRYIAGLKGKRLRPMLVYLAAGLHGSFTQKTLNAALVVELLHTATLVHDDVVDDSDLRRGAPTINNIWDNRISVLIGDLLFSRTLTGMMKLDDQRALAILSKTANRITEGELMQIERDRDFECGEVVYFDLVGKKTASLFSASCELGALSAGDMAPGCERMRNFGECLGIAFQIQDDLLDYVGDEALLGKPIGNDVRENKVTLPLIHALTMTAPARKQVILEMLEKDELDDQEIRTIIRFTREAGGLEYAMTVARSYADKAFAILTNYPASDFKASLETLVNFAITREN